MNLADLLPNRTQMSPEQLDAWLREHGGRGREALRYRKVKVMDPLTEQPKQYAQCRCSVCGAEWLTNIFQESGYPSFENMDGLVMNGQLTTCCECGAEVEAAYYTRLKNHPIRSAKYPWEVLKVDGCILFCCWGVIHEIGWDYDSIEIFKRNVYLLDKAGRWHRFTAMARSGWSSMSAMMYIDSWYKKDTFSVSDYGWENVLPHEKNVWEGTVLENAKMEVLEQLNEGVDLIQYARIYMRHKAVENITMHNPYLVVAGMKMFSGVTGMDWLNYARAKPHEMLFMEKEKYKKVCPKDEIEGRLVMEHQYAVAACLLWGASPNYAERLTKAGADFAFRHKRNDLLRRWGLVRVWNYIRKQKGDMKDAIKLCEDYWDDLPQINADLTDPVVIFPPNLLVAHAGVVAAIKYMTDKKLRRKFSKMAEKLQPLSWENNGIVIFCAKSEEDLIIEGKTLGHCVGRYGSQHCAGNSIFFIRKAQSPEIPYFTLQLNTKNGVVLQNQGKQNCSTSEEVKQFENEWLEKVVKPWLKRNTKKESKTA